MVRSSILTAACFGAVPFAVLAFQQPARKVSPAQAEQVRQIYVALKAHCGDCHGGQHPTAHLDLTTPEGILKGGRSGMIVTPGDPSKSILIQRLKGLGGKPQMPMGFTPFAADQIKSIEEWIQIGAPLVKTKLHWAYVKPVRPPVPKIADTKWVRNPVDNFIAAKIESEHLRPSPEAPKEILARRLFLDLVGLPPSPDEVDAFVKDTRPDAYERLVDRLLASKHYGERQARPWLDLARYADSDGYEKDLNRTAWKYRDWVIDAFNRNEPYDKFTIDQIAGDLLPDATLDQIVATGFNRNTMQNLEGGVDQAEAHFEVVRDRVDTTATVWLGSTLQCAKCHDHKYDPFSQKDYYSFAAFFSNSKINPRGPKQIGEEKWFETQIETPTPQQVQERAMLKGELYYLSKDLVALAPNLKNGFEGWKQRASTDTATWVQLRPLRAVSANGATLTVRPDDSVLVSGVNPSTDTYDIDVEVGPKIPRALRLEVLPDPSLANSGPGRADNGNFVLTGFSSSDPVLRLDKSAVTTDYTQPGYDASRCIAGDVNSGWAVNLQFGKPHEMRVACLPSGTKVGRRLVRFVLEQKSPYPHHLIGRFRLSCSDEGAAVETLVPAAIQPLLAKKNRTADEEKKLFDYYKTIAPESSEVRIRMASDQQRLDKLQSEIPTALVMRDMPGEGPLTAFLHTRGDFLSPAQLLTAATPKVLPPMPPHVTANRLGLAKWLVSRDNPLTARVEVNRMWEQFFGRGLVETSEDFGTQGSRPTHPELLDWLATEFMRTGWNMKAMNKLIVMSATYRQTSDATAELMAKDPQNLLLARGARVRMEAEMIRDTTLAASGLLNDKIGGPSVYPPQPAGVWDTPYNDQQWMESKGSDRYRRGLYTFWKRSSPYPAFMAFDATSRESCTVRRIRTNTPLQALELLNDQARFEAAVALGKRMSSATRQREPDLSYGFRLCTARRPEAGELTRLDALWKGLEKRYQANPKECAKLHLTPDQAAWTLTANVLLNLDETITKD